MFATVRRYAGLTLTTQAALTRRAEEIATVLGSVPGAYCSQLIETRDGVVLVTVGRDEACLVESARRFRAWVDASVPDSTMGEAEIWLGEVIHQVGLPAGT